MMKIRILFLISIFILFFHGVSFAQQRAIRPENISIEEGLSDIHIFTMLQARSGMMWFGTSSGLNKYDGYRMTVYKHDKHDKSSLSDNFIKALHEDKKGTLWIGTRNGGLNRFNPITDRFIHYAHDPNDPHSLSYNSVNAIYEDPQGQLWVGTAGGGLHKFNQMTGKFDHYRYQGEGASPNHNLVIVIAGDADNKLWIGTKEGGLHHFDPQTETFTNYSHNPDNPNSLGENFIKSLHVDSNGHIWIGLQNNGLDRFDPQTQTFTHYRHNENNISSLLSDQQVNALIESPQGILWIGTNKGVSQLNMDSNHFTPYVYAPEDNLDPYRLVNYSVNALHMDKKGLLWIGTYDSAVHKLNLDTERFFNISYNSKSTPNLPTKKVSAVYETPDGIWMGTKKGLVQYNLSTRTFTQYTADPKNPQALQHNDIRAILEDSQERLWLGTHGKGLAYFDRDTKTFTHFGHDAQSGQTLSHPKTRVLLEDSNGMIWVGTNKGLNRFDPKTKMITTYLHDKNNPNSLSYDNVRSLFEDSTGAIWIGTHKHGALNKFAPQTGTFTHYSHNPNNPQSLSNNDVRSIYEDRNNILWFGTHGGGLNKFDRYTETFESFRAEDGGLPNDNIYGIVGDDAGYLWLSTRNGLSRFNSRTQTFKNFFTKDGIPFDTFSEGAYFSNHNKEKTLNDNREKALFFGTENGITRLTPAKFVETTEALPVILTSFQKFNKEVLLDEPLTELKEVMLSWQENVFSFEFAALNYAAPLDTQYQYQLEGFDENWIPTDSTRRFVTYTNLDGGNYKFRVRASNNNQFGESPPLEIGIMISTPPWKTWWAYTAYGILVIGSVVGVYLADRKKLKNKEKIQKRLEKEVEDRTADLRESKELAEQAQQKAELASHAKSDFLSNMSHELRTPLNGILGYTQILQRDRNLTSGQADGLGVIYQSGNHLLTLINDILDISKIEAQKLELYPTIFHFQRFLEGITGMVRVQALEKNVQFVFEASNNLPIGIVADEKRLRQVLINLLGNAVKFTDEGKVILRVQTLNEPQADRQVIRFEIEDTGKGISAEDLSKIFNPFEQVGDQKSRGQGTGLGLSITRKLVALMDGNVQVRSELGKGSTFWFDVELAIDTVNEPESSTLPHGLKGYKGERLRILSADDRPENLVILQNMLEPLGFIFESVKDGKELVDQAIASPPDLILTDLVMPKMTGLEAAQAIRQKPELKSIPIIAVSASVFETDETNSKLAGCDAFLPKPVEIESLLSLLEHFLKLEWEVETEPTTKDDTALNLNIDELDPPPTKYLEALYEQAMTGSMRGVRDKATDLENFDEYYIPLAHKLKELAKAFEDKLIIDMLQSFLERAK